MKFLVATLLSLLLLWVSGCGEPSIRMGAYATETVGTGFPNPENLGCHNSWSEKNGQVYTCQAGHIDLAHLRKAADLTVIFAEKTFNHLMKDKAEFSFKSREPSVYFVKLTYPEDWENLSQKKKEGIARYISNELGQYFAYTATTWHEIITWFGYKCSGLYSEFPSAFSWEDTISNLLGTYVASWALQDTEHSLNKAMTLALKKQLEELDVQPKHIARLASKKTKGDWYSGGLLFFVEMKKRNFDIGLDGFVSPFTVPSLAGCEETEVPVFLVPNPDFLSEYGFSMKFEIKPTLWEKHKILNIVYPNQQAGKKRIEPAIHFAVIMDHIEKEAMKKYGPTHTKASLLSSTIAP
ncbi:MAG: DUF4056 domain-containing protein [Planctomycetota bacterium]|jgi:hypothetical protein